MAEQLSFDLPAKVVLGRSDFFVAPSNAMAVAMIDASDTWPTPCLVLTGPGGSGKTHLTHVWADRTGAPILRARDLPDQDIAALAAGPVSVEDVPDIATDAAALEALFHLYNLSLARRSPLLLTGRAAPAHWNLALPDIQSRVQAACHVALEAPDDTLLAAVLAKLFADRQIMPKTDVIPYLVRHMERSFQAASDIVARMDKVSLSQRKTLSRALARHLLVDEETGE
ncbi:P-loop NTPase family protein [Arenibacterium sp. CAU 1754]